MKTITENILLAAQEWYDARKSFLEKDGKTVPEDLIRLGNAEAALAKTISSPAYEGEITCKKHYKL